MKAEEYLKFRSIIPKNKKDLIITFDDKSEVSLVELLESFLKESLSKAPEKEEEKWIRHEDFDYENADMDNVEVKFDTGETCNYNTKNWPFAIVTHYREKSF